MTGLCLLVVYGMLPVTSGFRGPGDVWDTSGRLPARGRVKRPAVQEGGRVALDEALRRGGQRAQRTQRHAAVAALVRVERV